MNSHDIIITESFKYTFPVNAYIKFWDFYALEYLLNLLRIEGKKDVGGSFIQSREVLYNHVEYAFGEIVDKLFIEMYVYLKYQIPREFRHINNHSNVYKYVNSARNGVDFVRRAKKSNEIEIEGVYKDVAKLLNIPIELLKKMVNDSDSAGRLSTEDYTYTEMKHLFYSQRIWARLYGGKRWGIATDIFLFMDDMKHRRDIKKKAYYVDRVYDLEHNTGTILNKNDLLFVDHSVLDDRADNIKNLKDFYLRHTSEEVKGLIKRYYNLYVKNKTNDEGEKTMTKQKLKEIIKECICEEMNNGVEFFNVSDISENTDVDLNIKDLKDRLKNPPVEWANENYPGGIDAYIKMIHDKIHRLKSRSNKLDESTPPGFPEKVKQKILKQYGKTPAAYSTMWKLRKKYGKKLEEMYKNE